MSSTRVIAGAMSGTSADGVDVAVVRIAGRGYEMSPGLLAHHHHPYSVELREAIFAIRAAGETKLRQLAEVGRRISLEHAAAVKEALAAGGVDPSELACVAAHGQTLFHDPPLTIQWFDPALVAAQVGCAVVSDFRRADCAAGGQGAPLVPFADYILFRDAARNRVVVNIGGIANLTFVAAGGEIGQLIAFDTGPGNCISDWLCRRFEPRGPGMDIGGERAARGQVIAAAADRMLRAEYFRRRPPKSTDGPAMIDLFCSSLQIELAQHGLNDLLATACRITAESLMGAMRGFLPAQADEVILSGGGTHNRATMEHLRQSLGGIPLRNTDEFGVPNAAKEAMAFALLGAATLDGVAGNVPSVTGARRGVVLGAVTPRP